MSLETGTYVSDLVVANPPFSDLRKQGDDHLRLIKSVLRTTLPNASKPFYFPTIVGKTTTFTLLATEMNAIFLVTSTGGSFSAFLPTLASTDAGWTAIIQKTSTDLNSVNVFPLAGLINNVAFLPLTSPYSFLTVYWTGSSWLGLQGVSFNEAGGWINLSRITDSVITSNTTLANDSTMTFSMVANGNYEIEADIYFALSGGGYKISAAGPTAALVNLLMNAYEVGGTTVRTSATTYNGLAGTAATGQCRITMQVRNGAGAGAFALQFAQNTSNAAALYILYGSKMRYRIAA